MKVLKKISILLCIFAIGCAALKPEVTVEFSKEYRDQTDSVNCLLNFQEEFNIIGNGAGLKFKGEDKVIDISYELFKDDKLFKAENIIDLTMKKDFDGRVAVLVLYNPNKEQEEIKLFVDVTGRYAGGGARYINLPNFLYGGQKGGYDESEKKEISFNEEITIYNLVSQKRDGDEIKGPMWKLNVKLKVRDK